MLTFHKYTAHQVLKGLTDGMALNPPNAIQEKVLGN